MHEELCILLRLLPAALICFAYQIWTERICQPTVERGEFPLALRCAPRVADRGTGLVSVALFQGAQTAPAPALHELLDVPAIPERAAGRKGDQHRNGHAHNEGTPVPLG